MIKIITIATMLMIIMIYDNIDNSNYNVRNGNDDYTNKCSDNSDSNY